MCPRIEHELVRAQAASGIPIATGPLASDTPIDHMLCVCVFGCVCCCVCVLACARGVLCVMCVCACDVCVCVCAMIASDSLWRP